jgi:hypothetical protein
MELVEKYFGYDDGKGTAAEGNFRIGASQVSKFFDTTSQWYRENLLGEDGFTGNTASELGNCVHAAAAMRTERGRVSYETIEAYIDTLDSIAFDTEQIRAQYPLMVDTLLPFMESNPTTEAEKFIYYEILPGIGAGGSIDALFGDHVIAEDGTITYTGEVTIRDWKTSSALSPPNKFSRNYWFQQMVYSWVLKQLGITVSKIQLVYITRSVTGRVSEKTGKPLKDYPSQLAVVTEEVTDESLALIGSCLQLIAESVQAWNTQPELHHLLSQDLRLRTHMRPKFLKQ